MTSKPQCITLLITTVIQGVQMVLSMKLISIAFDMDADIQKDLMNPKPKKTEERVEEIAISKKGMIL